jgi:hypothetical protein
VLRGDQFYRAVTLAMAQMKLKKSLTVSTLRLRFGSSPLLELLCEGLVVEESPGVIELGIPRSLEISHSLYCSLHLLVADQR